MTTFLTALAPDARVKGSRDPLGLLPVWSRIGRRLIRNVTTVSGDLRGWTSLLLCVGMVRALADEGKLHADEQDEVFFRAEQFIAYSRLCAGHTEEIRGITRARAHYDEALASGRGLRLGTSAERRILGSQRSAGVWGQISASAEASGLVDRRRMALVRAAADAWDTLWWPSIKDHWKTIRPALLDKRAFRPFPGAEDEKAAMAIAALLTPALAEQEHPLVLDHILHGDRPVSEDQALLVDAWISFGADKPLDLAQTQLLADLARRRGSAGVADKLQDIVHAEHLLGPTELVFRWLLTQDRQSVDDVVEKLDTSLDPLGFAEKATDDLIGPPAEESYQGIEMPRLLADIRTAMVMGDWARAVPAMVELNARIMGCRGGAPWVYIRDGKLDVRLGEDTAALPQMGSLRDRLVHSYYLDPMRRLILAWDEGRHG